LNCILYGFWRGPQSDGSGQPFDKLRAALGEEASLSGIAEVEYAAASIGSAALAPAGSADIPAPEIYDDGELVVAASTRIDNASRMVRDLGLGAVTAPALIARGWKAWGDALPDRLRGDFAVAIYQRAVGRLILFTDPMGVRPLYYTATGKDRVAFCALAAPLVRAGLARPHADLETIAAYANLDFQRAERTALADIRRVRPGHVATVSANGVAQRRYWSLRCTAPLREADGFEAVAATLRRHIEEAVRRRLPRTGPAATHLTGGLDSSMISVLAARHTPRVTGYGATPKRRPDDPDFRDIAPFVNAVAQATPNLTAAIIDMEDAGGHADAPLAIDRPTTFWSDSAYFKIAAAASEQGADTILTGTGGDQLVSHAGRGAIAEMVVRGEWHRALREARLAGKSTGRSAWQVVAGQLARRLLGDDAVGAIKARVGRSDDHASVLWARFNKRKARRSVRFGTGRNLTETRRLWVDPEGLLGISIEFHAMCAARYGMVATHPLLDRDLVEYAIRIPPGFLVRDGIGRAVLREAARDLLPEMVRTLPQSIQFDPTAQLRMIEARDAFAATIDKLQRSAADIPIDLDALREAVARMPDAAIQRQAMDDAARRGGQTRDVESSFLFHYTLARFAAGDRGG